MSGHSKWANIRIKKGKTDAARGKIFTKLGRELAVAVKQGGPDPNSNSRLRDIIAKAKANNMPNDNISRSIKKAAGEGDGVTYEEVTYEGYGPGGVAVIVDVLTDNRNRAASEMRHVFDRMGAGMGTANCVAYMFDTKGVLVVERGETTDEDELMMLALDAGAEDFVAQDEVFEIYTTPGEFSGVREKLEEAGLTFASAELARIPATTVEIADAEMAAKVQRMIDAFEDNDDVQDVYHNAELPDEE